VQIARWGYQRTARLADDGWHQPARADGTCWNNGSGPDRGEDREELDQYGRQTPCKNKHQVEVVSVFAVDRDADSPYPGAEGIVVAAQRECGDAFAAAKEEVPTAELKVEYPTETGWDDADHDVACLIVTPTRTGALAE